MRKARQAVDVNSQTQCSHGLTSQHNTDFGIVRQTPESRQLPWILNQDELSKLLSERHQPGFWSKFECIQACIKARNGLGQHIPINFKVDVSN